MEAALSQDEVQALLEAMRQGQIENEGAAAAAGFVRPYDLTRGEENLRGELPGLSLVHERFCNRVTKTLAAIARQSFSAQQGAIAAARFADIAGELEAHACYMAFDAAPLGGPIVVVLPAALARLAMDRILGGVTAPELEDLPLTQLERRAIGPLSAAIGDDLRHAWSVVHPATVRPLRIESRLDLLGVGSAAETAILAPFTVSSGEEHTWRCILVLSQAALEPIRDRLTALPRVQDSRGGRDWGEVIIPTVYSCPVHVTVELGKARLSLARLCSLNIGDVLRLDRACDDVLPVFIEGTEKMHGKPIVSRGNLAIELREGLAATDDYHHE